MFCKKCGNYLDDDALFCEKCGSKVEKKTAAPQKPFPLRYILIPTVILAATAVLIAVLVTTLKPRQSVPASNGDYAQQETGNNSGGNLDTGNVNNENVDSENVDNENVDSENADNENVDSNSGSVFEVGGKGLNLVNAVYSRESGYTVVLFEGTYDESAVLIVAATVDYFDNSSIYKQSDFGDKIEVMVYVLDTNTGEYAAGSSATQGISGAQITTDENLTISVSGTLLSDNYGEITFLVNNEVTSTTMENIRNKLNAYNEFTASGTGAVNGDSDNGGQNQPIRCTSCYGSGNCHSCNGDGSCHICVDGMTHCLSCNGSRICQKCGGRGICPYCGGDGIMYN